MSFSTSSSCLLSCPKHEYNISVLMLTAVSLSRALSLARSLSRWLTRSLCRLCRCCTHTWHFPLQVFPLPRGCLSGADGGEGASIQDLLKHQMRTMMLPPNLTLQAFSTSKIPGKVNLSSEHVSFSGRSEKLTHACFNNPRSQKLTHVCFNNPYILL